jgi:hypothetical protein
MLISSSTRSSQHTLLLATIKGNNCHGIDQFRSETDCVVACIKRLLDELVESLYKLMNSVQIYIQVNRCLPVTKGQLALYGVS